MNKKLYKKPATSAVALRHQQYLLAGSGETSPRPSASFMSNPGIGDTDDE